MAKFDITVALTGEDGNAFSILARVTKALKRNGATKKQCGAYYAEATSGDYGNLLRVTADWVNVT
jgi:hypothetical protein